MLHLYEGFSIPMLTPVYILQSGGAHSSPSCLSLLSGRGVVLGALLSAKSAKSSRHFVSENGPGLLGSTWGRGARGRGRGRQAGTRTAVRGPAAHGNVEVTSAARVQVGPLKLRVRV